MKKNKAAAIYARTLLEVASDQKSESAVSADMRALVSAFKNLPTLNAFLTNPIRSAGEKTKLIQSVAQSVSDLTKKFLKLLEIKNRLGLLHGIAEEYLVLEELKQNILRANVVSAIPLNQNQLDNISKNLEAKNPGKKFILQNQIDGSLIAGFRIEQGDSITDASIKHKLHLLQQKLAA